MFRNNVALGEWPDAVEVLNEAGRSPFVLACEHASNHIPAEYHKLGLDDAELARHIAWDIGAASVTRALSKRLDASAFLSGYSRLLIDLNRPLHVADSIPLRSESTDIPGNLSLDDADRERRQRLMFVPFQDRLRAHLDKRTADGPSRSAVMRTSVERGYEFADSGAFAAGTRTISIEPSTEAAVGDERIVLSFLTERGQRPMPWNEAHVIA